MCWVSKFLEPRTSLKHCSISSGTGPKPIWHTLFLAVVSIGLLLYFKRSLPQFLKRRNVPNSIIIPLTKSGPLLVVVIGMLFAGSLGWNAQRGVAVVGNVPVGLPPVAPPQLDFVQLGLLLPAALSISLISFAESISVGKTLASRRRDHIDANQELIALGAANVGAAFTGGFPVTGGFSRSVVNFTAGANTGLASLITAGLVALTVTFFTPLFFFLPQSVLASIIMVAIINLIDLKTLRHSWHYNRADAASLLVRFGAVLVVGIERVCWLASFRP